MKASLEVLSGCIRTHPDGGGYGTDYDHAMSVVFDGGSVVVKGLVSEDFKIGHWRAVTEMLRDHGYHTLVIERLKNGQLDRREYPI